MRLNRRLAPDIYRGVSAVLPAVDGIELGPEDADGTAGRSWSSAARVCTVNYGAGPWSEPDGSATPAA